MQLAYTAPAMFWAIAANFETGVANVDAGTRVPDGRGSFPAGRQPLNTKPLIRRSMAVRRVIPIPVPALRFAMLGLVALGFVLSACQSSTEEPVVLTIRQTAEELIRTEVAPEAGLGELVALCPDVNAAAVGTAFDCTATTEQQRVISVLADIDETGHLRLTTTNLVTAGALPSFERAAVDALNTAVPGTRLENEAIDCGETSVLIAQDNVMNCVLLDPHTEKFFDVMLTIANIEARQFSLVVAENPRP